MARINVARKSGFIMRGGQRRRETIWFGLVDSTTTMVAAGGTLITSLGASALALRPFTIVRSYVELLLRSDQQAANEDQFAAYAKAVVSEQASGIGVTAVPTPITDLASDLFFLHQWCLGSYEFLTAASAGNRATGHWSVDSKAMRKVEDGQDLISVAEFSATGSGLVLNAAGRTLVKLH